MQMRDVVTHEEVECRWLTGRHGGKGALIQVVARVHAQSDVIGNAFHDAGQVTVVQRPEIKQLVPVGVLIPLCSDPAILLVAGKDKIVHPTRTHEPLMVV